MEPLNVRKSLIHFDTDVERPVVKVEKRNRKSIRENGHRVPCWFAGAEGKGPIDGVPRDYLVESLAYRGIAPNLKRWAMLNAIDTEGDEIIDELF